jgi:hypothetical protein
MDGELNKVGAEDQLEPVVTEYLSTLLTPPIKDQGPLVKGMLDILTIAYRSSAYQSVDELSRALAKFKVGAKQDQQRRTLVTYLDLASGAELHLRLPDVRQQSDDVKDALAMYVNFAQVLTLLPTEKIKIFFDESLGNRFPLPVATRAAMQTMASAARSASGNVASKEYKLKSGAKAPIHGLVCLLRVLTKYQPFYRKRSKKECTTLQELKDVLD